MVLETFPTFPSLSASPCLSLAPFVLLCTLVQTSILSLNARPFFLCLTPQLEGAEETDDDDDNDSNDDDDDDGAGDHGEVDDVMVELAREQIEEAAQDEARAVLPLIYSIFSRGCDGVLRSMDTVGEQGAVRVYSSNLFSVRTQGKPDSNTQKWGPVAAAFDAARVRFGRAKQIVLRWEPRDGVLFCLISTNTHAEFHAHMRAHTHTHARTHTYTLFSSHRTHRTHTHAPVANEPSAHHRTRPVHVFAHMCCFLLFAHSSQLLGRTQS